MTCVNDVKTYWRVLLARWALFSLAILVVAIFRGQDPRAIWPLALLGGGLINIAWIWVA